MTLIAWRHEMYIPDADEKKMARRFTNVEEEDLSNLLDNKDSKNTKKTHTIGS